MSNSIALWLYKQMYSVSCRLLSLFCVTFCILNIVDNKASYIKSLSHLLSIRPCRRLHICISCRILTGES